MDVIDRLTATHDKDPAGAAKELRELDPKSLSSDVLSTYSWLLCHVLGELSGSWKDVFERHQQFIGEKDLSPVVHRNYAAAAVFAGKPLEAWSAQEHLQTAYSTSAAETELLVRFTVLQYSSKAEAATSSFADALRSSVKQVKPSQNDNVVRILGASLNNIVSSWLEEPYITRAPINEVMVEAARKSYELWQAGGTWMNVERACYLRALAANHVENWAAARDAAQEGLKVIDTNGEEDVDRAGLLLESARAYGHLSQLSQQKQARETAIALSKKFLEAEPELKEWFDSKLEGA